MKHMRCKINVGTGSFQNVYEISPSGAHKSLEVQSDGSVHICGMDDKLAILISAATPYVIHFT